MAFDFDNELQKSLVTLVKSLTQLVQLAIKQIEAEADRK